MRLSVTVLALAVDVASAASFSEYLHDLSRNAMLLGGILRQKTTSILSMRSAIPNNETPGTYAPIINAACPPTLVRQPSEGSPRLLSSERDWVSARRAKVVHVWSSYLKNPALDLGGFDVDAFVSNTDQLPQVAIAASGGGYRAMLHGASLINALDSRTAAAVAQGTGGVLQLATYISGLSGGSWLVGSLAINDFPTIPDIRGPWNLGVNLVDPSGVAEVIKLYTDLQMEVDQKDNQGFDVSITDYWGRALSRHLVNNGHNGIDTTYSSIRNLTSFATHNAPFPIIVSEERAPGQLVIPVNTTIYEYTPFEFGSRNSDLEAFIPMEYLGTSAIKGQPETKDSCVLHYDNAGFIMGTSGSLFNQIIYDYTNSSSVLKDILGHILADILGKDNDIATYPNPFKGLASTKFDSTNSTELDLVDGGEDGETLPFWPFLDHEREVDVIVSLDGVGDTDYNWPNGNSLVQTQNRMKNPDLAKFGAFPKVPTSTNTLVNHGLNRRPTFFGCKDVVTTPLVVYIPNAPFSAYTNYSTFQFAYNDQQIDAFLENGLREARHNGTSFKPNTPTFPTCLACALVSRAERRAGLKQSESCSACFDAYCWDGVEDDSTPGEYNPTIPGVPAATQAGGAGTSESPTPGVGHMKTLKEIVKDDL